MSSTHFEFRKSKRICVTQFQLFFDLFWFRMLDYIDDEQSAVIPAEQTPTTVLLDEPEAEPSEDTSSEHFETYFSDEKVQIPERVSFHVALAMHIFNRFG